MVTTTTAIVIGNTVKIQATVTDYSGTAVDVDTITVAIYTEDGTSVLTATAMTHSDTGIYYYEYDTTSRTAGYYYYYVSGTDGTAKFKAKGTFTLKN